MTRIVQLAIKGYRSIGNRVAIDFPDNQPLILLGENNAGKSNIVRALDIVLGESWPGTRKCDDHDFWDRKPENGPIEIYVRWENLYDSYGRGITSFHWKYAHLDDHSGTNCTFTSNKKGESGKYVRSDERDKFICIMIGADRQLSYQLSYQSKWTLLSKLMRKFHQTLTANPDRVRRLKDSFGQVKDIFAEVPEFANFREYLVKQFASMLEGLTYGLKVDFSAYDPSNYFHSLKLLPSEDDEPRTFEELGSGQEQVLALVAAYAYAKAFYGGIALIIEEPEAHLHPLAQQWLARVIHQMARDGLQIIITTHSPYFVDILALEGVILVSKYDSNTTIKQLKIAELTEFCISHGADPTKTTEQSILPYYAAHATQDILSGFFAKKIVLVEGPTEYLSLPVYFARVGLDILKRGIQIITVGGKGNLAKWWRFFSAYGIPTYVVFDNDKQNKDSTKQGIEVLQAIGIDNEISTQIVQEDAWIVNPSYCVLGENFEVTMRRSFPGYEAIEGSARELLGSSKPLVARYVAERITLDDSMAGWQKFRELARAIRDLAISGESEEIPMPDDIGNMMDAAD